MWYLEIELESMEIESEKQKLSIWNHQIEIKKQELTLQNPASMENNQTLKQKGCCKNLI